MGDTHFETLRWKEQNLANFRKFLIGKLNPAGAVHVAEPMANFTIGAAV